MNSRIPLLALVLCGIGINGDLLSLLMDDVADITPKPCCFPETWHGHVKIIFGVNEKRRPDKSGMVKTEMFFDGRRKRAAGKVNTGHLKSDFTFVGLFNETTGKGFRFYSYKTYNASKCWTYHMSKFQYHKPCLPESSNFKGTLTIGLLGSGLVADAWIISEHRSGFNFTAEFLVSQNGCVPIIASDIGSSGFPEEDDDELVNGGGSTTQSKPKNGIKKFVVGALYSNMELQITDESVFHLPLVCRRNLRRFPPNMEDLSDPESKEGWEYLEAVMGHVF